MIQVLRNNDEVNYPDKIIKTLDNFRAMMELSMLTEEQPIPMIAVENS